MCIECVYRAIYLYLYTLYRHPAVELKEIGGSVPNPIYIDMDMGMDRGGTVPTWTRVVAPYSYGSRYRVAASIPCEFLSPPYHIDGGWGGFRWGRELTRGVCFPG